MAPEIRRLSLVTATLAVVAATVRAQQPGASPAQGFRRAEVMIPMRDGVRLSAVIMSPGAASGPLPILLTRTPYGARGWPEDAPAPSYLQALAADGYIFVQEDIRGRNGSEGSFVMNRPNRGAADSSASDESTDTYDTVDWLIHHVPDNNGRVGIFGISYPGWLTEEALIGPHPAGGERLGNIEFGSATADTFLVTMQAPWFAYWLKGRGDGHFPAARLFDAGTDRWSGFAQWPPREAARRSLYLHADGGLSFDAPAERSGSDAFVSDPAHPVPYRPRPVEVTYSRGSRWRRWMTEDQRFVDGRPDVLTWQTAPLAEEVTIAGDVTAHLFAATTGSDADWVVKLIDVFPDTVANHPELGGYELMVAGDIMRGRYRRSWERPEAIPPKAVEQYTVDLHQQLYTFRRGHRIMVQVQSTWFPLYDRNPQTYVPNIFEAPASAYLFEAPASAYLAETHRVYRTAAQPSGVEVMVLPR